VALKWYGNKALGKVEGDMAKKIAAATIFLRSHIATKLSEPPPPSAPGEYPHRDSSQLLKNIEAEYDATTGRVGTNVKYGKYLEFGTKKMKRRPWLSRGLAECEAAIRRIIAGKGTP